jgi:hypothetical protein
METTLLPRFIGYPTHDLIEKGLAGSVHAAEIAVITGLDGLKAPQQKVLLYLLSFLSLYTKPLGINY